MKRSRFGLAVVFALLCIQGCRAPSIDWNGKWKLNPTKSSYQGQVLTIAILAEGEYLFKESSSHTLRCDGKERPIANNQTLGCVKSGDIALDITLRVDHAEIRATHDEISTDGKLLTTTVTELRPNGPVVTSKIIFSRLSGADGFAGRWLDTSFLQQHATMVLMIDSRTLHISYPGAGQQIDAPLDGVETRIRGPRVLEGGTFAVRPAGRREFRTLTKRQGKLFNKGTLELSKDGRTIADSWWNPSQPADTGTLVYEKQ